MTLIEAFYAFGWVKIYLIKKKDLYLKNIVDVSQFM